jgi:hypothetical protein
VPSSRHFQSALAQLRTRLLVVSLVSERRVDRAECAA